MRSIAPGALTIEEREAEPYDERIVMAYIIKGGENVIKHILNIYETTKSLNT